ncbi:hypothetical protein RHGRI_013595 [Rhododendron griersonianum]|uniref:Uncharacterized protein n=1 Tax=Rhododendron griersonianum TaxID=479676 RepID=A0AAV6K671_9ERIC|nr:hypothetical protein RHGRI_013595 [Rhododendron griersonianum]
MIFISILPLILASSAIFIGISLNDVYNLHLNSYCERQNVIFYITNCLWRVTPIGFYLCSDDRLTNYW